MEVVSGDSDIFPATGLWGDGVLGVVGGYWTPFRV